MHKGWRVVELGDVCTLTKGQTPTQKAIPGQYPLVVTAAEFLTSSEFQFDGEAVCVPMVSSTGHGHASLKRVHYASGKFAVANIITALQAKPGVALNMRWLWLYLDHLRDDLIVPRMKGTANVTISQKVLATVPVLLPSVDEQRRIVDLIGALDETIEAAESIAVAAENSASEMRRKMISMPEANMAFRDAAVLQRGFDLPASQRRGGDVAVIASGGPVGTHSHSKVAGPGVVTGRSGTIGLVQYIEGDFWPLNTTLYVKDFKGNVPAYVRYLLEAMNLNKHAGGSTVPSLNRNVLDEVRVYVPEVKQQHLIVETLDSAYETGAIARGTIDMLRALRSNILTALLSSEHEIPESYDDVMEVVV